MISSVTYFLQSASRDSLAFPIFISHRSSDLSLVSLRKPHDSEERAESAPSHAEDDSRRPSGPQTRDRLMGADGSGNNPDRAGGEGFQLPRKTTRPARSFERPRWRHLCLHVCLCIASYPVVYAGTTVARNRSLFWARVIVGLWCAAGGGHRMEFGCVRFEVPRSCQLTDGSAV